MLLLKNLHLEYLDLYLIHSPVQLRKGSNILKLVDEDKLGYNPSVIAQCWEVRDIVCYMYVCECTYGNTMHTHTQGMEELISKGLVKAIGISNFTITKTEHLLQTAKIVPAVNQVECHPYLQQPKLKEYLDSKGG